MLDVKFVTQNIDLIKSNIKQRHMNANVDLIVQIHNDMRLAQGKLDRLNSERNKKSKVFPSLEDEDARLKIRSEINSLDEEVATLKSNLESLKGTLVNEMYKIPNLCASDVPEGKTDEDNLVVSTFLAPPRFGFNPKSHIELMEDLDLVDFSAGARVTGSKFYFLKNEAVILELALIRFALDIAMKHGFSPMLTPDLARNEIIRGSGFEPRGEESQIYRIEGEEISLIGTSEITIGGYYSNEVLDIKDLPVKKCGVSQCFRTEAGAYGRESKGLYRVHQFNKVELYYFCLPEESDSTLETLREIEEEVYQTLELPYQVVSVCKGDLGAPAFKKYDIEAWMLSKGINGGYGEVTSASNCTDYQTRRLNIRFRNPKTKKLEFVHTLNGTAIATTRTMLAIIENFQDSKGNIVIPKALRDYTGFDKIEKKNI